MAIPLTAFEQNGRTAWTTLAEEAAWYEMLLASTNRITMTVAGHSVDGNPLRLFRVGTGPRTVLWTSLIHANEQVSREVMLTTMRRWAESTDPDLVAYLQQASVYIMPTINPDRFPTLRVNRNNVNINRDFLQLTQPETRVVQRVLRDLRPEVFVDWHEFHSTVTEYQTAPGTHPNGDPSLFALATDMHMQVKASVEGRGWTWRTYPIEYGPDWLINTALLQHAVSVLLETSTMVPMDQRHDMHLDSVDTAWRWHAAHLTEVRDAVASARASAATRKEAITLAFGANKTGPMVKPVPRSYRVTAAQWETLEPFRDLLGITGRPDGDGYSVPLSQSQQVMVAYLLDPASPQGAVAGEPRGVPSPGVPIPRTGYQLFYRQNGRTYPATLKVKP